MSALFTLAAAGASAISFTCPTTDVGGTQITMHGTVFIRGHKSTYGSKDDTEVTLDAGKGPEVVGWGRVTTVVPGRLANTPIRFTHHIGAEDAILLMLEVPGGAADLGGFAPRFKAMTFSGDLEHQEKRLLAETQCSILKSGHSA